MIEVFDYEESRGRAGRLREEISFEELGLDDGLVPKGLVADVNGHLWFGATNSEEGFVVEINPETKQVISKIGKIKRLE